MGLVWAIAVVGAGSAILRTDEVGAVSVLLDGPQMLVEPYRVSRARYWALVRARSR